MVVVDTNVLAYLLIEGDRTAAAQALYARDADWRSESFLLVEFSNMLATYVRNGRLDAEAATALLAAADRTLTGTVSLPHPRALEVALEGKVNGEEIAFRAGGREYRGRMNGKRLELK